MSRRDFHRLIVAFLVVLAIPANAEIRRNERLLIGIGPGDARGGQFNVFLGRDSNFYDWSRQEVPWGSYVDRGGAARPAVGDLGDFNGALENGPGKDEAVIGLSSGGAGWLAIMIPGGRYGAYILKKWIRVPWAAYNDRNGETFPAVGNLDGDPWDEIVVGLGATGSGWFAIFDDASTDFSFLGWRQLQWPAYNAANGALHPSIGDLDGDGTAEIVLGLDAGGGGWLAVIDGAASGFAHRRWLRVSWPAYNERNGLTYPAVGDVDGDGRGEIVVGLGPASGGWVEIMDDAAAGFGTLRWIRSSRADYNARNGETHPAAGDMDDDGFDEIVLGQGEDPGGGRWVEIIDDSRAAYASLALRQVFGTGGATATYPAAGRLLDGAPCPDCVPQ